MRSDAPRGCGGCRQLVEAGHRVVDAIDGVTAFFLAENATAALRNSIEYEQALYQANAGVQHVLSQLETDVNWRGTATAGSYPASGSYSATAVNGAISGTVDVTATGVAGATTRRVQATILVN